jgi:hypothetical protein
MQLCDNEPQRYYLFLNLFFMLFKNTNIFEMKLLMAKKNPAFGKRKTRFILIHKLTKTVGSLALIFQCRYMGLRSK